MRSQPVVLCVLAALISGVGCNAALKATCVMTSMGTEGWTKCDEMEFPEYFSDDELLGLCRGGDLTRCEALLEAKWDSAAMEREARLVLHGFCDGGRGEACTVLSNHTKAVDEAFALALSGCERGDLDGCEHAARRAAEPAARLELLTMACRADAKRCYAVVRFHLEAGDTVRAKEEAIAGCRRDNDDCCDTVGRFHVGMLP